MHFILSFKITYLNATGRSVRPEHVARINKTNKIRFGWRQHLRQF